MPRWVRRAILVWWASGLGLLLAIMIVRELQGLLVQIVVALFLSFAMEPVVERFGRHGIGRGPATGITMLVVAVALIGFVTVMGTLIADQIQALARDLPGHVNDAASWAETRFDVTIETEDVVSQLQEGGSASQYITGVADNIIQVGASVLNGIFQFLTIFLFAYYFTADGHKFRVNLCSILPPARQMEVLRVWELGVAKTGAFISSRIVLAILSSIFHWVVFRSLGLPSALALAFWVGIISQFVPVVGIYIAGILPALISLTPDTSTALWVVIAMVAYQQIENYGLQPRVTAHTLNMHPAVAFGAVLAGTATFGVSGALLALPFVATVQSFISVYVSRHTVITNPLVDLPNRSKSVDLHDLTVSNLGESVPDPKPKPKQTETTDPDPD